MYSVLILCYQTVILRSVQLRHFRIWFFSLVPIFFFNHWKGWGNFQAVLEQKRARWRWGCLGGKPEYKKLRYSRDVLPPFPPREQQEWTLCSVKSPLHQPFTLLKVISPSLLNAGNFFHQENILFKCKEMGIFFFSCISPKIEQHLIKYLWQLSMLNKGTVV